MANIKKLILGISILLSLGAQAKNPIPADTAVLTGKLPNGYTYYIRQNRSPKGMADFFIACRTGSVNEEENQRGLAHFLEHMCFNGTEHFPGNSLITWLESVGVKFGANLNAYTSTDETVYNICQVPTTRQSTLDSCLLILRDWSCGLTLDPKEIDKERGVVKGEWRQRNGNAMTRLLEKSLPAVYAGSRYGERMPIGKMEVVENFSPRVLRDFYEKWQSPENQAIVIVGDFNPKDMETMLRSRFASIKPGSKAMKTPVYTVPDNERIIASVASDPELQTASIQLFIKHPDLESGDKATIDLLRERYIMEIAAAMLAERFDEAERADGAPLTNTGTGDVKFLLSRNPRAWTVRATARPGREKECVSAIASEVKRAADKGFLETEFNRAKIDYRSALDSRYVNRATIDNTDFARRYVKHFIDGGSIPSEEAYYKMMKGVMAMVKLADVNRRFAEIAGDGEKNIVLMTYLPADASKLTSEDIAAAWRSVNAAELPEYADTFSGQPILASEPVAGKVVKEEKLDRFGAKIWTLSNGAKVYLRHNSEKPDNILIQAYSPGGVSQFYNPEEAADCLLMNDVLEVSAFGPHSASGLRKVLAGHKADVKLQVENMEDRIAVSTTPADLDKAMQALHLKATSLHADPETFATLIANQRMKLESQTSNPTFEMGDSIHANVYAHHPLGMKLSLADLDKVNLDRIIRNAKERFSNLSDFSFFISGNFDEDSLRRNVEKYIASLPGTDSVERPRDIGYRYAKGDRKAVYERTMETPASITYSLYTGAADYDLPTLVKAHALGNILSAKLRDDIREEKGWTYGVRTHIGLNAGMNGDDAPQFLMPVYIRVEPGKEDECLAIVEQTVGRLSDPGFITAAEVEKEKGFALKNIDERDSDNGYWNSVLHAYDRFGEDMHSNYEAEVKALSPDSLAEFAGRLFAKPNITRLVMKPAGK